MRLPQQSKQWNTGNDVIAGDHTPISRIWSSATLVLTSIRIQELRVWTNLQWHDLHTKFMKTRTDVLGFFVYGRTERTLGAPQGLQHAQKSLINGSSNCTTYPTKRNIISCDFSSFWERVWKSSFVWNGNAVLMSFQVNRIALFWNSGTYCVCWLWSRSRTEADYSKPAFRFMKRFLDRKFLPHCIGVE